MDARICITCGSAYDPTSNHQRFCSASCRYKDPARTDIRKTTRAKSRKKRRDKIRQIKIERGCEECGYNKHPSALEFDHIDPEDKEFELSKACSYSWERVEKEINKCRVLCANCHAIHSDNQRGDVYA